MGLDTKECTTHISPDIPEGLATEIKENTGVTNGEILMVTDGYDCDTPVVTSIEPCDVPINKKSKLILYDETTVIYLTNGDVAVSEGKTIFDVVEDECGNFPRIFIGKFKVIPEEEGKIQGEIESEIIEDTTIVQAEFLVKDGEFEIKYDAEIVASIEKGVVVSLKTEDGKLSQAIFMDENGTTEKVEYYNENVQKSYAFLYENGKLVKSIEYDEDGNEITVFLYNEEGEIASYEDLGKSEGQEGQTTNSSFESDVTEPADFYLDVKNKVPNGSDVNGNNLDGIDNNKTEIKISPSCSANPGNQMPPNTSPALIAAMLFAMGGNKIIGWLGSLTSKKPE